MAPEREYEAAYFTLLRARDELTSLLRYAEHLQVELARLDAFSSATEQAELALPKGLRRPVSATTKSLLEAVGARRNLVLSEQSRMDERLAAAQDFVAECEAEVEALRR